MARIYHWQDSGSPGRSLTGDQIERFRQILYACLVTGYGSKPGAGWTQVHNVTGGFSLRNATGTGIVNFVDSGSTSNSRAVRLYLLESAGNTSAALLSGDNLRSGAGAPSTNLHSFNFYPALVNNLGSLVWTVVADEKTFAVYVSAQALDNSISVGNINTGTPPQGLVLYVGEDSKGNFIALGGCLTSSATMSSAGLTNGFAGEAYTGLRDPLTGLIISGSGSAFVPMGLDPASNSALTETLGEVFVAPIRLRYGATSYAKLRGVVVDHGLGQYNDSANLAAIGLAATADNRGKPSAVGGVTLAMASGWPLYSPHVLFTDHADYW